MADPTRWHELMAVFANSGQKGASGLLVTVPSPEEVTAPRWTRAYWNYWAAFPWTAMKTWKYSDGKFFTLQRQAGIGLADGENDLDRDGGPWPNFNMGSAHLLGALGGAGTNTTSLPSFAEARRQLTAAITFFHTWQPKLEKWQKDLGEPSQGWEGSAAGAFAGILGKLSNAYKDILSFTGDTAGTSKSGYLYELEQAETGLRTALTSMWKAYDGWQQDPTFSPAGAIESYIKNLTVDQVSAEKDRVGKLIHSTEGEVGYVDRQATWDTVEAKAKAIWAKTVADKLDSEVPAIVAALNTAYRTSALGLRPLPQSIQEALASGGYTVTTPPPNGGGGDKDGPPGGTGGDTPPPGTGGDTPPGGTGGDTPPGGTGGDTPPPGQTGDGPPPPGQTGDGPPPPGSTGDGPPPTGFPPPGQTKPDGKGDKGKGPDGKNPDGTDLKKPPPFNPNDLPPGQTPPDKNGTDHKGQDKNHQPPPVLPPPFRPPGQTPPGAGPGTGSNKNSWDHRNQYQPPDLHDFTGPGSTHYKNHDWTLPPGTEADNRSRANHAPPGQTDLSRYEPYKPEDYKGDNGPQTSSTGTGYSSGSGGSSDGTDSLSLDSNGNLVRSGTGGTGGGSGTSGGGAGSQMPYMPPMGGMGGGGGGGGKEGQERERTTWLSEDEEVWGTDPDLAPMVLGRPTPEDTRGGGYREQQPLPGTAGRGHGPAGTGPRTGTPNPAGPRGGQRDGHVPGSYGQRNG